MISRYRSAAEAPGQQAWLLWASELSPFALKVDALCDYAGLEHRWIPAEGSRWEGLRTQRRVRKLVAGRLPLTYPKMSELDEFPQVPFLLGPAGENLYDSSAIGEWLDLNEPVDREESAPLLRVGDPALRFAIRLVDEYFDEIGLYLVHHNRWVVAARNNDAGARLAAEFRPVLGVFSSLLKRVFPARQVRRLPYLFSVAPQTDDFADLPARLRPPAREGFPPTHALLEGCFANLLAILEQRLTECPFLFGAHFTLADASAYGQLGMNLSDPSAAAWIERDAPHLYAWLQRIARADFSASWRDAEPSIDPGLRPLLTEVCATFCPLMRQNAAAWLKHSAAGDTHFNEAAFDAGRALYEGELAGHAFRSVAKTFQVSVWRALRREWDSLAMSDRARLEELLPSDHGLDLD